MRDVADAKTLDMGLTTLTGYARVSTSDQNLDMQIEALEAAGCHKVFTDVASGARTERPGLDEVMRFLRPGDTLLVWKIDRLGRSMAHLVQLIETLKNRGVAFRSLSDPGLDTTTPSGKMMFSFFAMMADYERELIRERTRAGMATAKARGRSAGRRPVMTPEKIAKARKLLNKGDTVRHVAYSLQVSKTALYEALRDDSEQAKGKG